MNRYTASASFSHGQVPRTALVMVQLGTPDAPTAPALRRYLKQFLSDPRVVEIPKLLWQPILRGPILTFRPKKSAAKYASIWTEQGSPLRVNTERQAQGLQARLAERGHEVAVVHAMRYGEPSVPSVLRALREQRMERLLVLPMYPQYAGSTTATVFDAVFQELGTWRNPPELRTVKHFHDDAGYIDALAAGIRARWDAKGRPQKLVLSFHGTPEKSLHQGDPYHCECHKTARLLAARLGLAAGDVVVTFQSRFGPAKWLQPYTEPTLVEMARQGVTRVDVACPGFVSDCLETLEEIAQEAKEAFLHAGGQTFDYHPCVNDDPAFIGALADLAERHLAGWPTLRGTDPDTHPAHATLQRERALALGAPR